MDNGPWSRDVPETLTRALYLLSCVPENLRFQAKDLLRSANCIWPMKTANCPKRMTPTGLITGLSLRAIPAVEWETLGAAKAVGRRDVWGHVRAALSTLPSAFPFSATLFFLNNEPIKANPLSLPEMRGRIQDRHDRNS